MTQIKIYPTKKLQGTVDVPGDKSISHRAVMFGSLAKGATRISHFLTGADCLSTIDCFRCMGISIDLDTQKGTVLVQGNGLHGLNRPDTILQVGNSGTTTRLISGILCGQPFESVLSGDESLNSRPMKRIMDPLTKMHARIESVNNNGCAPLRMNSGITSVPHLQAISHTSKVASAQVKSAILLAGLYANGVTSVTEPALSRDHTERMLRQFGAKVQTVYRDAKDPQRPTISIHPGTELYAQEIVVPGDISSAAYFIAAALLVPHAELLIKNVGMNPTRAGILDVLQAMGADITFVTHSPESESSDAGREPAADLLVRSSSLHGTTISGSIIPTLIDEIPMIAVLAAFAEGETIIKDAAELKVKETDRIATVTSGLRAMGADVEPTQDGMIIRGGKPLHGAAIDSFFDHRIAMAFSIAGLAADGETTILNSQCIDVSYPGFYETLARLSK